MALKKNKIGIFMHGQAGDIGTATSVFKYKDIIWKDKDVVWFVNEPNSDLLKFNPFVEIRSFAHGWEIPSRCLPDGEDNRRAKAQGLPLWEDWSVLKNIHNNRLNQELKHEFELTKDLEEGYFPAPYHLTVEKRHGIDYPNISRKIFGISPEWAWHPVLFFSDKERNMVEEFCKELPYKKTVMIETFGGSGQTKLNDNMIKNAMQVCREKWNEGVNFIFTSHKYLINHPEFPAGLFDEKGVVSCADFTVRQCALVNNYCDLMICVSSGISVSTSCWGNKPVPKIQYCGSFICSTVSLANGHVELITSDGKMPHLAEMEFDSKLKQILNQIN